MKHPIQRKRLTRLLSALLILALGAPTPSAWALRPVNAGLEESPVRDQLENELNVSAGLEQGESVEELYINKGASWGEMMEILTKHSPTRYSLFDTPFFDVSLENPKARISRFDLKDLSGFSEILEKDLKNLVGVEQPRWARYFVRITRQQRWPDHVDAEIIPVASTARLEEPVMVSPAQVPSFDFTGTDTPELQQGNVLALLAFLGVDPQGLVVNVGSGVRPLTFGDSSRRVPLNLDTQSYAQQAADQINAKYADADVIQIARAVQPSRTDTLPEVLLFYRMGSFVDIYHGHNPQEFWQAAWKLVRPGGWILLVNPPFPEFSIQALGYSYQQILSSLAPGERPSEVRVVTPDGTLPNALTIAIRKPHSGVEEPEQALIRQAENVIRQAGEEPAQSTLLAEIRRDIQALSTLSAASAIYPTHLRVAARVLSSVSDPKDYATGLRFLTELAMADSSQDWTGFQDRLQNSVIPQTAIGLWKPIPGSLYQSASLLALPALFQGFTVTSGEEAARRNRRLVRNGRTHWMLNVWQKDPRTLWQDKNSPLRSKVIAELVSRLGANHVEVRIPSAEERGALARYAGAEPWQITLSRLTSDYLTEDPAVRRKGRNPEDAYRAMTRALVIALFLRVYDFHRYNLGDLKDQPRYRTMWYDSEQGLHPELENIDAFTVSLLSHFFMVRQGGQTSVPVVNPEELTHVLSAAEVGDAVAEIQRADLDGMMREIFAALPSDFSQVFSAERVLMNDYLPRLKQWQASFRGDADRFFRLVFYYLRHPNQLELQRQRLMRATANVEILSDSILSEVERDPVFRSVQIALNPAAGLEENYSDPVRLLRDLLKRAESPADSFENIVIRLGGQNRLVDAHGLPLPKHGQLLFLFSARAVDAFFARVSDAPRNLGTLIQRLPAPPGKESADWAYPQFLSWLLGRPNPQNLTVVQRVSLYQVAHPELSSADRSASMAASVFDHLGEPKQMVSGNGLKALNYSAHSKTRPILNRLVRQYRADLPAGDIPLQITMAVIFLDAALSKRLPKIKGQGGSAASSYFFYLPVLSNQFFRRWLAAWWVEDFVHKAKETLSTRAGSEPAGIITGYLEKARVEFEPADVPGSKTDESKKISTGIALLKKAESRWLQASPESRTDKSHLLATLYEELSAQIRYLEDTEPAAGLEEFDGLTDRQGQLAPDRLIPYLKAGQRSLVVTAADRPAVLVLGLSGGVREVQASLGEAGVRVRRYKTAEQARAAIVAERPDLLLVTPEEFALGGWELDLTTVVIPAAVAAGLGRRDLDMLAEAARVQGGILRINGLTQGGAEEQSSFVVLHMT